MAIKVSRHGIGRNRLRASQPDVFHRGIGHAEDGFNRAHIGDGEAVCRRANQLSFINISLYHPSVEWRTQLQ